ncbi:hypothetical protein IHV25_04505 [Phaeovibrio sulfidiphilus]|uniref:Uncharacterized protein n=1 Tax=Phaeovibrio sulfidiphilus TaxID=1220600 RepID=A0A8J6YPK9_9PROT|nr:hypothetical protein [Phaeovibrio sulfidiphilus]MBE1236907.1 hypothetical protein [Phaeovibrio sulfidiphilus]
MAISPLMSSLMPMSSRIGPNALTARPSTLNPFAEAGMGHQAARLYTEMEGEKEKVALEYQAQAKALDLDEKRIFRVMKDLATAKTGLEKALKGKKYGPHGIETVEKSIEEMRTALGNMEEAHKGGNQSDLAYYKSKYDNALARLNDAANDYNSSNNLIGSPRDWAVWAPNSLEYRARPNARSDSTISGQFLGSDFRIELDAKTVWSPSYYDATTSTDVSQGTYGSGGNLTLYKDYNPHQPHASGGKDKTVAFKDLTLEERSGDQITLSYKDGDETVKITGTLKQGGLGVGPSCLYTMDEKGFEAMRSDLSSAGFKVFAAKTAFEGDLRALTKAEKRFSESLKDIAKERQKLASLEYLDKQDVEKEYRRQFDVMQQQYDVMTQAQQAYVQVFQSTMVSMGKKNPFFDIMG